MVAIFCMNRGVAQSVERLTVPTVVRSIPGARSILRVLNGNCEIEELPSLPCKCLDFHSDDHLKWRSRLLKETWQNGVLSFRAQYNYTPVINNYWTRFSKIS